VSTVFEKIIAQALYITAK